jgi:hypothetical protein
LYDFLIFFLSTFSKQMFFFPNINFLDTFDTFVYNTFLGDSFEYSKIGVDRLQFGWQSLEFILQFHYHICSRLAAAHVCEDGYIQVYTTKPVPMMVEMDLSLTAPTATISNIKASITNATTRNDLTVNVDCTNLVCLIPVNDIAQQCWNQFPTVFSEAVEYGIQSAAQKYPFQTIEQLNQFRLSLEGDW